MGVLAFEKTKTEKLRQSAKYTVVAIAMANAVVEEPTPIFSQAPTRCMCGL